MAPPASPTGVPDAAAPTRARIGALDGLRGLALVGMLAWHAEVGWVRGGFARMTIFFVLAGYLAARSLARSREADTGRAFVTFWGRRARRLLPVTLLGVAWALVVTAWVGSPGARAGVTGDVAATLASVANWRFIALDQPYGALFESGTAFQHYWSLAVEEQAFLVLPLLLATAVALVGGRRGLPAAASLTGLGLVAGLAPLVVHQGPDTVYYGTHVRIGEFLVGAALAEVLSARPVAGWTPRTTRIVGAAGALGLAGLGYTMLFVSRDQTWLYRGGLIAFALPAVAVVAAAESGGRIVTRVLDLAPLRALGRWALPVYVLHWPLYQLLGDGRVGLSGNALVVAQLAASIALGGVVHHLVERPLMAHPVWGPGSRLAPGRARRPLVVLGAASVVLVLAASAVPVTRPEVDLVAAEARIEGLTPAEARAVLDGRGAPLMPIERLPEDRGVALFGGSSALTIGMGAGVWADPTDGVQDLPGYGGLGCGLLVDGVRRGAATPARMAEEARPDPACRGWELTWPAAVTFYAIDIPVVVASTWDLDDWRLDGGSGAWTHVGEPEMDAELDRLFDQLVGVLHSAGAADVVLLTPPPPAVGLDAGRAAEHEERSQSYEGVVRQVAARHDRVHVVDLGGWLAGLDDPELARLLPDGVHASQEGAEDIWDRFLGPALEAEVPLLGAPAPFARTGSADR